MGAHIVLVLVLEKPFHPARLKYPRLELWVISAPQTYDVASKMWTGLRKVFVPKGLQDSARGFNPGNTSNNEPP
jgi:hypothetical protein